MTASILNFRGNIASADPENQQVPKQYNSTATRAKMLGLATCSALATTTTVLGLAQNYLTGSSNAGGVAGRELLSSHCDPHGVNIAKGVLIGAGVATGVGGIASCALSGDPVCESYSLAQGLGNLAMGLLYGGMGGLVGAGIAFGVLKSRC